MAYPSVIIGPGVRMIANGDTLCWWDELGRCIAAPQLLARLFSGNICRAEVIDAVVGGSVIRYSAV